MDTSPTSFIGAYKLEKRGPLSGSVESLVFGFSSGRDLMSHGIELRGRLQALLESAQKILPLPHSFSLLRK